MKVFSYLYIMVMLRLLKKETGEVTPAKLKENGGRPEEQTMMYGEIGNGISIVTGNVKKEIWPPRKQNNQKPADLQCYQSARYATEYLESKVYQDQTHHCHENPCEIHYY